ncbi:MAG: hypothetical protein ACRCX2_22300 [Paraclostridium sp.]
MAEEINGLKDNNEVAAKISEIRANGIEAAYQKLMADQSNPLYIYLILMIDELSCSEKCGEGVDRCNHKKIRGVHCHSSPFRVTLDQFQNYSCEQYAIDRNGECNIINVIFSREYGIALLVDDFYKQELEKLNIALAKEEIGSDEYRKLRYMIMGVEQTRTYSLFLEKRGNK